MYCRCPAKATAHGTTHAVGGGYVAVTVSRMIFTARASSKIASTVVEAGGASTFALMLSKVAGQRVKHMAAEFCQLTRRA